MEIPRYWRLKKQRYSLVGETCPTCKAHLFPPRAVCPHCADAAREPVSVRQEPALIISERLQVANHS